MNSEIKDNNRYTDFSFEKLSMEQCRIDNCSFDGCDFDQCAFSEGSFLNCRFVNCTFVQCDLSLLKIGGSVFSGCQFEESRLLGVNWTEANWSGISLRKPVSFDECNLRHSTFIGLDLKGLVIRDCLAAEVDFRDCDLAEADFRGSDLSDSLFMNTNLESSDLTGAIKYDIAPQDNVLTGAKFTLPEAMSLLLNMDIILVGYSD